MPRVKAVPQKRVDHETRNFFSSSLDRPSLLNEAPAASHGSSMAHDYYRQKDASVVDEFEGMFVEDHDSEAESEANEDEVTPSSAKSKRANGSLSTPSILRTKRQKMYPSSLQSDANRVQKGDGSDLFLSSLPVYWYNATTNLDKLSICISGADIFLCDTQGTSSSSSVNVAYVINHDIEEVSETIWRSRLRALQHCVDRGYMNMSLAGGSFDVVLNLTLKVDKVHREGARVEACLMEMIIENNLRCAGGGGPSIFHLVDKGILVPSFLPTDRNLSFDADSFLHEATMHSQLVLSRIPIASLEEMATTLEGKGLRTALRPYQKQAIQYLYHRFVSSMEQQNEDIGSSSRGSNTGTGNDISPDGWVNIPLSTSQLEERNVSGSTGIDLFRAGNRSKLLWYNLLSGQICSKRYAPSVDVTTGAGAAIMLSDEPGLGKTIQILSLILLVKLHSHMSNQVVTNTLRESVCAQARRAAGNVDLINMNSNTDDDLNNVEEDAPTLEIWHDEFEAEQEQGCLCCAMNVKDEKSGHIQCDRCRRWLHISCAGFGSQEEASAQDLYICVACANLNLRKVSPLVSVNTVLVIVPDPLLSQWNAEVWKHFRREGEGGEHPLKVAVYDGCDIKTLRKNRKSFADIQPDSLAQVDVLLVTLRTLQSEFYLSNLFPSGEEEELATAESTDTDKRGGRSRRYEAQANDYFPPPFLCVKYKMVVVDETQKIEGITETVAMSMAKRIAAWFRISVSATPLGHNSLRDIAALCNFLQVRPLNESYAFKSIFERKAGHLQIAWSAQDCYLKRLLLPSFVRRTKQAVQDQLGIPPKQFITTKLNMSQFEMALYKERETPIIDNLHIASGEEEVNAKISLLRKGCCHPQILDPALYSRHHNTGSRDQGPRPFAEIMVLKVEQMRQKCEEVQRNLLFQLFTMGGVALLRAESSTSHIDFHRAMQVYSFSLQVLERNRREVSVVGIAKITGEASFKKKAGMACLGSMLLEWDQPHLSISKASATSSSSSSLSVPAMEGVVCGRYVDIGFNTGRRVLSMSVGGVSLQQYLPLRKNSNTTAVNSDSSSSSNSNSVILLIFPKDCELLTSKSIGDPLSSVHRFSVPLPSLADLKSPGGPPSHSENIPLGSVRAKTWRLIIKQVHRNALLVMRDGNNELQCQNVDVKDYPSNGTSRRMAISLNIKEALFDADFMQELHLYSSMIYTHQLMSQVVAVDDSTEVQAVTLEMLSARLQLPSASSSKNDSTSSTDGNGMEVFNMASFEQRRDNIQNNFLQTTANRRDVTLYHLQELKEDIRDNIAAIMEEKEVEKGVPGSDIGHRWWLPILEELQQGMGPDFFFLLDDTVASGGEAYRSLSNCRTIVHLGSIIEIEYKELMAARTRAMETMISMKLQPSPAEVDEVGNCRVCCAYFLKTGPKCFLCKKKDAQEDYRKKLFAYRSSTKRLVTNQNTQGKSKKSKSNSSSNNPSPGGHRLGGLFEEDEGVEMKDTEEAQVKGVFHMLAVLLKNYCSRLSIDAKQVTLQVKILGKMENELKALHALWNRQSEFIKAHDELEMCKSRLQLLPADVDKPLGQEESYVWPHELEERYLLRYHEAIAARNELGKAISQLSFFKSQIIDTRSTRVSSPRGRGPEQTTSSVPSAITNGDASEEGDVQEGKESLADKREDVDTDSDDESDHVCPICREDLEVTAESAAQEGARVCILPCAHRFHETCIKEWTRRANRCPCCKTKITATDLRTFVGPALETETEVNTAAGERLNEDKDAQASEGGGEALVRIVGQWGTKIDSLVLDLLLLRMKEETSSDKCVVFSQWTEVLEIVGKALESNGLNFVLCSKKQDFLPHKNLSRFRSDPSVQVLLLPINLGAEGLDLVHANHVFLLEPLLNKTTEIQAINRCDRLGQIKTTRVVKYIIRGTIEERILNQSEELSAPVRLHSPVKSRLKDELHDLDEIRFLLTGRARGESDAIEMV